MNKLSKEDNSESIKEPTSGKIDKFKDNKEFYTRILKDR